MRDNLQYEAYRYDPDESGPASLPLMLLVVAGVSAFWVGVFFVARLVWL